MPDFGKPISHIIAQAADGTQFWRAALDETTAMSIAPGSKSGTLTHNGVDWKFSAGGPAAATPANALPPATRYDLTLDRSSAAPGQTVNATVSPHAPWPKTGAVTLTPSGRNGSPVTVHVVGGSTAPATGIYTPAAAGEVRLVPTNDMGLADPAQAPLTVFTPSKGTPRKLTVTAAFTDPQGGRVLHRRGYQKSTPAGTPNGFDPRYKSGWGKYWLSLASLDGPTDGLFMQGFDARSAGATDKAGTGTKIQDTVQVYGPVSGPGVKEINWPASRTLTYVDVATDAAMTNPVRIPYAFYMRNVLVVLTRSQEAGSTLCSWSHGGVPGRGFLAYDNGNTISSSSTGSDTSVSDPAFATAWGPVDGVTDTVVHNNARANSVGMQEISRLFETSLGDGISLAGVYQVDGGNDALFTTMIGPDGTLCAGLRQAIQNQVGGEFRHFRLAANDGGDTIGYGTDGTIAALKGLVAYFGVHNPACATFSLTLRSGLGASAVKDGTATIATAIRDRIEAVDPRVVSVPAYDWFGFGGYDHGHPAWGSQGRIGRNIFRAAYAGETAAWGGAGRAPGDRYTELSATGTMAPGSGVIEVPIDLAPGATMVSALTCTMAGGDSDPIDLPLTPLPAKLFRGWIYAFAGSGRPGDGSKALAITGGEIGSGAGGPVLRLFLDTSAGAGTVKYSDGSSGAEPATINLHVNCNHNLAGIFPDFGLPMLFDDRVDTALGIPYGWPIPARTDIAIARTGSSSSSSTSGSAAAVPKPSTSASTGSSTASSAAPAATQPAGSSSSASAATDYFPANSGNAPFPSPENSLIRRNADGSISGCPYLFDSDGTKHTLGAVHAPNGGWYVNDTMEVQGFNGQPYSQLIVRTGQVFGFLSGDAWQQLVLGHGTYNTDLPAASTGAASNTTSAAPATSSVTAPANPTLMTPAPGTSGRTLSVGSGQPYATITAAIKAAQAGDTVSIGPGLYKETPPCWTVPLRLVFQAGASMDATGLTGTLAHGKGVLVPGADSIIEGAVITGCALDQDAQGTAAIRPEGGCGYLTIINPDLSGNQNGIAGGAVPCVVVVKGGKLHGNGLGDGRTHNIYMSTGTISLTMTGVDSTAPKGGHAVKSRAFATTITGGSMDATDATVIDIPDGSVGQAIIDGTTITKPAGSGMHGVVGYAVESASSSLGGLLVRNATINALCDNPFVQVGSGGVVTIDATTKISGTRPVANGGTVKGL